VPRQRGARLGVQIEQPEVGRGEALVVQGGRGRRGQGGAIQHKLERRLQRAGGRHGRCRAPRRWGWCAFNRAAAAALLLPWRRAGLPVLLPVLRPLRLLRRPLLLLLRLLRRVWDARALAPPHRRRRLLDRESCGHKTRGFRLEG
jgi:hypothetical protein